MNILKNILKKFKKDKTYNVGGLFAGIGGIELGFKQAGFDICWANEVDSFACQTYQLNHNHTLIKEDIRNLNPKKLPKINILVGGFPCQTFSTAGKRKGLEDKDKGQMFFEVLRFIKATKPEIVFLENVKGLKIHDSGKTLQIILDLLQKEKYYVKYQVLNTMEYSIIPQGRERIYIVCFKDKKKYEKFSFPKKEEKTKHFREFLEKKFDKKYIFSNQTWQKKFITNSDKSENYVYLYRYKHLRKTTYVPTIATHQKELFIYDNSNFRYLTPRELLNYQGFPASFKFPKELSDQQKYKQIGNSVTVPIIKKIATQIRKVL